MLGDERHGIAGHRALPMTIVYVSWTPGYGSESLSVPEEPLKYERPRPVA